MQLFSRLGAKQSLGTLGLPLFSSLSSLPCGSGLCPGDVVEVMGGEGSGKSELLLNITAQCVLPRRWCGREIGGKEVEVVWVSTDYKFDVLRLVAVLEGKLIPVDREDGDRAVAERLLRTHEGRAHLQSNRTMVTPHNHQVVPSNTDYQTLISSCLSRVHVVYCNSSTELGMTLHSLRLSLLRTRPNVCALVLDNVAEFHWLDRAEARTESVWVGALDKLVEEHHVVVFSAKPLLFVEATNVSSRSNTDNRPGGKVNLW